MRQGGAIRAAARVARRRTQRHSIGTSARHSAWRNVARHDGMRSGGAWARRAHRCGAARCACIGATRGDPRRCAAPRGARETAGCRSERPLRSTLNPLPRAATRDDARHGARIGVARPGATRTTCCAKARSEGIARCAARQKRAAGQSAQRGKGAQRAKRAAWRGATRRAWLGAPRRAEARHGLGGAGTARLGATATDGSGARPIMAAEPAAPAHGRRSRCSATSHTIRHTARSRRDPCSPQSLVRLSPLLASVMESVARSLSGILSGIGAPIPRQAPRPGGP